MDVPLNRRRTDIIEYSVENEENEISLPQLPYSDYIWMTEPPDKEWEKWFKEFYHIPKKTTLGFDK